MFWRQGGMLCNKFLLDVMPSQPLPMHLILTLRLAQHCTWLFRRWGHPWGFVLACWFMHSALMNCKLESICDSGEGTGDEDSHYLVHSHTPFIYPCTSFCLGHFLGPVYGQGLPNSLWHERCY